ncbi:MAG: DUF58 domain-containing protein [Pseudomonadota bacterium]
MLILAAALAVGTVVAVALGEAPRDGAIVAWAALLAAALADIALSVRPIRTARIDLPTEVFVGERARLRASFEAESRGAPDRPEGVARLDWPAGLKGPRELTIRAGADGLHAEAELLATRRGAWEIGTLWVLRPSRFGLFEIISTLAIHRAVRVVPNIRLVQSGQIAATVISTLYGVKENRAIGDGSEFHQLREFSPGMDVKAIDWKRSAKQRVLLAKELRAERNHHVILAIDNGYLMSEEIAGLPKIDHAITAALATAWAAAIGGDLVGAFSYDARPRSFRAPVPGRQAFAQLRSWTAELSYVARETNHTLALSALKARTPKRSLIIIFTDFVDVTSAELLVENLAMLVKRHVVIFVAIRDPDLERRVDGRPDSMDAVAELVTANLMLRERRTVFERLARLGVSVVDARPGEVTAQVISTYLEIKTREMI